MNSSVSVIIPVYNGEKFLRRAIESVVNQTYIGDYEVLLIDDGSIDDTAAICKEYAEKYSFVRYCYHDNMGISKTRERAVELAQGDYLCWVDTDDYISPDLLKLTMEKIEATGADICTFSWQGIYEDGRTVNHLRKNLSIDEWRKQTMTGELAAVWSYICRKNLWDGEKSTWQVKKSAADSYMTPILFQKTNKIVAVPQILYYYKQDNPYSISHIQSGLRILGGGYAFYCRFKMCLEKYPEMADSVGRKALRWLIRAYCVSTYLEDLSENEREMIRSYILDVESHMNGVSFKYANRIFFIRHRWNKVVKLLGKRICKKGESRNKKLREMMKE